MNPNVDSWPRRAAVVGVGTMGTGFVQLLALAGINVVLADVSPQHAQAGRDQAIALAGDFTNAGLMRAGAAETIAAHVTAVDSVSAAAADAELVLEAVLEDSAVKAGVYAEIEGSASHSCVIATNTSAIPIHELAATLVHLERFVGAHWFNPPQWVPCVEVIPTAETADDVVDRMCALLRRLGKRPVTVGDAAGFVANRIQFAMFKEAAAVVADGVASAEEVDEIVRSSFGFRLPFFGPFTIADMAGLDVYAGAYRALAAGLGERFTAPGSLSEHVAAGRVGTKSGGGYLEIESGRVADLQQSRDRAYVALGQLIEHMGAWD